MQKHTPSISSYHFRREKPDGLIQVLNEGSYLMAEYSDRTGVIKWRRVVQASQREMLEKRLRERFPVQSRG